MKVVKTCSFIFAFAVLSAPLSSHSDDNKFVCRFLQTPHWTSSIKQPQFDYGRGSSEKEAIREAVTACEANSPNFSFLLNGPKWNCHDDALTTVQANRLTCALSSDIGDITDPAALNQAFAKSGHPFVGDEKDLEALLSTKGDAPSVSTDQNPRPDDMTILPEPMNLPQPPPVSAPTVTLVPQKM